MSDNTRPDQYAWCKIDPTTYNLANSLSFVQGSVVKYITRGGHKDGAEGHLKDAQKCVDYALIELNRVRVEQGHAPLQFKALEPLYKLDLARQKSLESAFGLPDKEQAKKLKKEADYNAHIKSTATHLKTPRQDIDETGMGRP